MLQLSPLFALVAIAAVGTALSLEDILPASSRPHPTCNGATVCTASTDVVCWEFRTINGTTTATLTASEPTGDGRVPTRCDQGPHCTSSTDPSCWQLRTVVVQAPIPTQTAAGNAPPAHKLCPQITAGGPTCTASTDVGCWQFLESATTPTTQPSPTIPCGSTYHGGPVCTVSTDVGCWQFVTELPTPTPGLSHNEL